MISNERQYRVTNALLKRFQAALDQDVTNAVELPGVIAEAMRNGMKGEVESLRSQVADYEAFRSGKIRVVRVETFSDLPDLLIRARIASGLTQRQLAEEIGVKEQQIQRYEATKYESASFSRLEDIVTVLGLKVSIKASLPTDCPTGQPHGDAQ